MADLGFSQVDLIKKGSDTSGIFDQAKFSKRVIGIALLALLGVGAFYLYGLVLPFIVATVWGTVELIIGAALAAILIVFILSNIKNFVLLNDAIARFFLGKIITMAPFMMQEKQIKQAEDDMERMVIEKSKIEGKYNELSTKVTNAQNEFQVAQRAIEIAKQRNDPGLIEDNTAKMMRSKRYVDSVAPLVDNMKFIIGFVNEGSKVMKRKIANARADLNTNKDIFETVITGSAALNRMKRAMIGDATLNNQAEQDLANVMKSISLSIGEMRTSMEIISDVTKAENIEDAAKLSIARDQLVNLKIMPGQAIPLKANENFKGISQVSDMQFPLD